MCNSICRKTQLSPCRKSLLEKRHQDECATQTKIISFTELHFWNLRLQNLHYIYEQLREPRVRSMAVILEKTNSAYYSCFKNLFKNIVIALAEAKNICLYLKPLKKHIALLEETDFSECIPVLAPLMHVVCLIWCNSKCYDQVKIIVLLKQICNLLIQEVSGTCKDQTYLLLLPGQKVPRSDYSLPQ